MSNIALRTSDDNLTPEQVSARIEELKRQLAEVLTVTAEKFVEAGRILKELDDLGADTSDLKMWWIHYIRKVAYGQLLAELVVRYFGNRNLLAIMASLPLQEQRSLAAGEGVKLLAYSPNGQLTHMAMQPLDMTADQLRQAFDRDHIRTEGEQSAWMADKRTKAKGAKPDRVGDIGLDRERMGLIINRRYISLDKILAAVKALQGKTR